MIVRWRPVGFGFEVGFLGGYLMHGLIFVTWEKYLVDRFGGSFLSAYHDAIGEIPSTVPLASRVYDDANLLAGVGAASKLAHFPVETLLREYGRYFLINGLTSHLCAYLLTQVHSGRELLLMMRLARSHQLVNLVGAIIHYAQLCLTPTRRNEWWPVLAFVQATCVYSLV
jgi:heme-NO-binding protein